VYAAGNNDVGQLGLGHARSSGRFRTPVEVERLRGRGVRKVPPPIREMQDAQSFIVHSPTFPPTARPTVCPLLRDIMLSRSNPCGWGSANAGVCEREMHTSPSSPVQDARPSSPRRPTPDL